MNFRSNDYIILNFKLTTLHQVYNTRIIKIDIIPKRIITVHIYDLSKISSIISIK